jgi:hypothetical protein
MVTENPRASSGHEKRSRTASSEWRKYLMRLVITFLLAATLLVLAGCSTAKENGAQYKNRETETTATAPSSAPDQFKQSGSTDPKMQTVSLTDAQANQQNANATERKIIRNADLTLETESPSEGQRKVAAIAEARGGFVVTSDARQRQTDGESRPEMVVTVVARVPAAQFTAALEEIRALGSRVHQEKITGQDVTE